MGCANKSQRLDTPCRCKMSMSGLCKVEMVGRVRMGTERIGLSHGDGLKVLHQVKQKD